MKCYYPIDSAGNRIGFKTPEACVYDASGTSLTTKLAQINSNINTKMTLTSTTLYSSSKDGELRPSQTKSLYGDVSQYKYLVVNAGGGLDQRVDLTIYTSDLDSTHGYALIFINTVDRDEYIIYSSLRFPTNSSVKLDTAVRYNFYTNNYLRYDNEGINVHTIIGYKY